MNAGYFGEFILGIDEGWYLLKKGGGIFADYADSMWGIIARGLHGLRGFLFG